MSELLAAHNRSRADTAASRIAAVDPTPEQLVLPRPGRALVRGPIGALELLAQLHAAGVKARAVVLDPMYRNKNVPGRAAYLAETIPLITAASQVAPHIFIWGFPESVARLVDHWPSHLKLEGWLTWFFKNAPSRSKSWRPSQQTCLHLRRRDGKLYPEHFYSEKHRALAAANRLEFKMTPYSVFQEALLSGFIKRSEQTGFRYQKPESVIEPLLRMTTKPGDLVIDPTAGSGTTGAAAVRLGCAALLSDRSAAAIKLCRERLAAHLDSP
ncbi:DNA methyltransferase [Solimonas fluminis]|nr:DNA methyltransferase [Solimonas fluminis]MDM4769835.1 DNA methyltransferase [Solimonas sp. SE-A11]